MANNHTRRLTTAYRSDSAAAKFARTVHMTPTPWIKAAMLDPNADQRGSQVQHEVRFRFWIRARGRTLHVETHPNYHLGGQIIPLRMSRPGLSDLIRAGEALVQLAKLDRTSSPAAPAWIWNKSHIGYPQIKEHVTEAAAKLHRVLFASVMGRPSKAAAALVTPDGMPPAIGPLARQRVLRRKEYLDGIQRMLDILAPLIDRSQDKRRMRAYPAWVTLEVSEKLQAAESHLRNLQYLLRTEQQPDVIPVTNPDTGMLDGFKLDLP